MFSAWLPWLAGGLVVAAIVFSLGYVVGFYQGQMSMKRRYDSMIRGYNAGRK